MNTKLLEMIRLQAPERVRLDAESPGKPLLQVVIDIGPNAGMTIAQCQYQADARLIAELWNFAASRELKKLVTALEEIAAYQGAFPADPMKKIARKALQAQQKQTN